MAGTRLHYGVSRNAQAATSEPRCSLQAIAKAETVRATQRGWVGSSTLCLGKTPGQDGLAALLLLVRGGTAEPAGVEKL